jgi:hypothetical protein
VARIFLSLIPRELVDVRSYYFRPDIKGLIEDENTVWPTSEPHSPALNAAGTQLQSGTNPDRAGNEENVRSYCDACWELAVWRTRLLVNRFSGTRSYREMAASPAVDGRDERHVRPCVQPVTDESFLDCIS